MLIGLSDDDGIPEFLRRPTEAAPAWSAPTFGPGVFEGPDVDPKTGSTPSAISIFPAAKKAAPRVGPTKILDAVLPRTLGPTGAVKIFGLPPAVAYTLVALLLTGVGLAAYKSFAGGPRRTAKNPRQGRGRGGKARRKR